MLNMNNILLNLNKNRNNENNGNNENNDYINTTIGAGGRFCNNIIRNIVCSEIAKKHNLRFIYSYFLEMDKLGINLYIEGKNLYKKTLDMKDNDFFTVLNQKEIDYNIYPHNAYFQIPEIAKFIREYFCSDYVKNNVIKSNYYKNRYNKNNDVFLHIRLGDAAHHNPGFDYYDNLLKNIDFDIGYISSDSINNNICKRLIEKYNLIPFQMNEVRTIMFGSTCKNIILSNGSFSWIIGVMGYYSNIYYPNTELLKEKWCGNIFVFDDWNKINY